MNSNLRRIQAGTLKAILLFLWLAIVLLIIGIIGNLFKISVMNAEIWQIFSAIIGLTLLLGFINMIISLNIMSTSIASYSGMNETTYKRMDYKKIAIATLGLVIIILSIQYIIKVQVNKKNLEVLRQEVISIGNSSNASKIISLIEQDAPIKELYFSRDALLLAMKNNSITLLVPKSKDGNKVFYSITPWDYDSSDDRKISEVLEKPYIPDKKIKAKFDQMMKDRKGFEIENGNETTIFYPIEKNSELKLILIISSKTEINYDYLKERSSASLPQ